MLSEMFNMFPFLFFSNWHGRRLSEGGSKVFPSLSGLLLNEEELPWPRTVFLTWTWTACSSKICDCLCRASSALAVLKGKSCETSQTWVRIRDHGSQVIVHGRVPTADTQGSQDGGHLIAMDCQCKKGEVLPPNSPHPFKKKLIGTEDLKCRRESCWDKV